MRENIFDSLIESDSLFVDRQAFEHGFEPDSLPHREKEVRGLGENLVEALRGHIPSNMLLYGVPGSGKTIVTKTVLKQLKSNTCFRKVIKTCVPLAFFEKAIQNQ